MRTNSEVLVAVVTPKDQVLSQGGAPSGRSFTTTSIDYRHRVFGDEGPWVVDGSAMSANPGVNRSLTITALAERAMKFVPPKESGSA